MQTTDLESLLQLLLPASIYTKGDGGIEKGERNYQLVKERNGMRFRKGERKGSAVDLSRLRGVKWKSLKVRHFSCRRDCLLNSLN